MIVFSTLDHQLFCLDKDSGIVTKKWALWQRSPQLVHDDMIFFINDMGALTAFDAVTQKILWQHENFSGLVFESLLSLGEGKIVAQTAQQKLNFIDTQNGATIFEYEHAYPDLKIFASDEQQHIFALDQYRNFIDIPGTFIS
jgi:hypothetical protein